MKQMQESIKELTEASMKLGEAVYKNQQEQKTEAKDKPADDDGVVDADFEEVKDDKRKKRPKLSTICL